MRETREIGVNRSEHRFLGFYRREINGQPHFVYRCVCGYMDAVPLMGGPYHPLDRNLRPRPDARKLVAHLELERAHELN